MIGYFIPVLVVFGFIITTCTTHYGNSQDANGLDDDASDDHEVSCQVLQDIEVTVAGRIWVNPNPIVFGTHEGRVMDNINVLIANIGTEDLTIDRITFSGDMALSIFDDVLEPPWFPKDVYGSTGCTSGMGMFFPANYEPTNGEAASGTVSIHTSDSTSPTMEVAVIADTGLVLSEHPENQEDILVPAVKPNPVRLDSTGGIQQVDLCFSIPDITCKSLRVLAIEVTGAGLSVGEITDHDGNPAVIPTPEDHSGTRPNSAVLIYDPGAGQAEGGSIIIELEDMMRVRYTLVIPVIIR